MTYMFILKCALKLVLKKYPEIKMLRTSKECTITHYEIQNICDVSLC